MFSKLDRTAFPPSQRPLMVWDGQCDFCAYWITRWQQWTGDKVDYKPYQEVAEQFSDINPRHFTTASRLIETDGRIYSGPQSAFRTFTYRGSWGFLDRWYEKHPWFARFSDHFYQWVARHRNGLFRLSKFLFGADPLNPRPFWAIYLALGGYIIYSFQ